MPKLLPRMLCMVFFKKWQHSIDAKLNIRTYRGSYDRINICSPSVHVDDTWTAVKKCISDVMKLDAEKDKLCHEECNPVALKQMIETRLPKKLLYFEHQIMHLRGLHKLLSRPTAIKYRATIFGSGYTSISGLTSQCDNQIHMAVGAFKTMHNGILRRAIPDFRWFYGLKATPNRPSGAATALATHKRIRMATIRVWLNLNFGFN